jgi:hypothetical protein
VNRFERAVAGLDAVNAGDPNRVTSGGEELGKELLYARRMTAWLDRLEPDASEELRLAVRAQHIGRWKIARADYPEGRAGYKRWRSDLARMHGELAGEVMAEAGYPPASIQRVADLLMKKRLKSDGEVQTLEDVACLVFLEHYFADFARKHDDAKLIEIVRKTWRKMSDRGHAAAARLELPEPLAAIVRAALA